MLSTKKKTREGEKAEDKFPGLPIESDVLYSGKNLSFRSGRFCKYNLKAFYSIFVKIEIRLSITFFLKISPFCKFEK